VVSRGKHSLLPVCDWQLGHSELLTFLFFGGLVAGHVEGWVTVFARVGSEHMTRDKTCFGHCQPVTFNWLFCWPSISIKLVMLNLGVLLERGSLSRQGFRP
jgi:hypothetical protein